MNRLDQTLADIDKLKELIVELHERKRIEEPIGIDQVGEYIKSFRKERNVTQQDFAVLAGVSKNVLAAIEAGKQTIKLENFLRVTNTIGLKVSLHE
ncbi:MAG: helix-turn-helix domain-containing protein [Lentisphaeraceae bacterium]|nr:helix-turn-helix domain-containing protein [Lentisphaeraceae bacterium]